MYAANIAVFFKTIVCLSNCLVFSIDIRPLLKTQSMLIEVEDKVVSTQIFDRKFVCDLTACKGACCIEGDAGAPLTLEEVSVLEDCIVEVKPICEKRG